MTSSTCADSQTSKTISPLFFLFLQKRCMVLSLSPPWLLSLLAGLELVWWSPRQLSSLQIVSFLNERLNFAVLGAQHTDLQSRHIQATCLLDSVCCTSSSAQRCPCCLWQIRLSFLVPSHQAELPVPRPFSAVPPTLLAHHPHPLHSPCPCRWTKWCGRRLPP